MAIDTRKSGGLIKSIFNGFLPSWSGLINSTQGAQGNVNIKNNLQYGIAPVQLQRIKQDIQSWRDSIGEAENSWYPHRVKMQQNFIDTILNGHVKSCMDKRKDMTLLKKHRVVNKKTRKQDDKFTDFFNKKWFELYREYEMDSDAHGYNLVTLGPCVNNEFPEISFIKRFNISPDRLNVTEFIYSISGYNFLQPPYCDWHVWMPTPSDVGVSRCGYGYLYEVAFYEIVARNVLTQNLDTTEMYGSPMRVGKTNKSQGSAEREVFEGAMASMGGLGWIVMDAIGDEVELVESKSLGNGYKIYESLEGRVEKKISKIILGHADALDTTAGKLGGNQDGEESPAAQALRIKNTKDMTRQKDHVNSVLIPKLNKTIGLLFPCQELEWEFDNDEEEKEVRRVEDEDNEKTAAIFMAISQSGGDPDWGYFTERTGIPVTKTPVPVMTPGGGPGGPGAPTDPGTKPEEVKPDDKGTKPPKVKGDKVPVTKVKASTKEALDRMYNRKKTHIH